MKINIISGNLTKISTPIIVVYVFKNDKNNELLIELDNALNGTINEIIKSKIFEGNFGEFFPIYTNNKISSNYILLVGLGSKKTIKLETLRLISGEVINQVKKLRFNKYVQILNNYKDISLEDSLKAIIEGKELASYSFNKFKSNLNKFSKEINELNLFSQSKKINKLKEIVVITQKITDAVNIARNIANTPGSNMTPSIISRYTSDMAKKYNLYCKVFGIKELTKIGMGGLLSVSKGSKESPKMIMLEHHKNNKSPIVLIGKGVTFDSGGISIKPSDKMDQMKYDKSGATSVIATMQAIAALNLKLHVIALIPLTENLPSGSAYKPGDVITHYNKKTSEVINTDAEGRLILADALSYATKFKPQAIIDLATLTGACIIALGSQASGLFTNNKQLNRKIQKSADNTHEKVWLMPLWDEYNNQIKSNIADIKNTGGRSAGAITAAIFLSHFVDKYPWAHIDIAGTAWTSDDGIKPKSYNPKGATGIGVRLLINLLLNWNKY